MVKKVTEMMTPENIRNQDRRIQRCIDQELSSHETRELLFLLDAVPDGWKTLACGLLEERNFQRAMTTSAHLQQVTARPADSVSVIESNSRESQPRPLHEIARRTWAHPLVSLTLCAAIAFVGGLLIPGWAPARVPSRIAGQARPIISATDPSRTQSYFVEMQPGRPVEVPVVSEVRDLNMLGPDHPLHNPSSDKNWIVVPVGRDSVMLIPASQDPGLQMQ
jgi:hypothetical protein